MASVNCVPLTEINVMLLRGGGGEDSILAGGKDLGRPSQLDASAIPRV